MTVMVDPGALTAGTTLHLPRTEAHHLRVRRIAVDSRVRLLDGHGVSAEGIWLGDGRVEIEVVDQTERPVPLTLAVGAGDRERFTWLVEKSAELGVSDVIPLDTERTAGVATRITASHVERLQRRAFEGIKQSGALWAPVVHAPHSISELVARHPEGLRWIADATGTHSEAMAGAPSLVAVGPEGGFTAEERLALLEAGFLPVRLSGHILRFETAAVAAAAVAFQRRESATYE